jgi:hypothetical protein
MRIDLSLPKAVGTMLAPAEGVKTAMAFHMPPLSTSTDESINGNRFAGRSRSAGIGRWAAITGLRHRFPSAFGKYYSQENLWTAVRDPFLGNRCQ